MLLGGGLIALSRAKILKILIVFSGTTYKKHKNSPFGNFFKFSKGVYLTYSYSHRKYIIYDFFRNGLLPCSHFLLNI